MDCVHQRAFPLRYRSRASLASGEPDEPRFVIRVKSSHSATYLNTFILGSVIFEQYGKNHRTFFLNVSEEGQEIHVSEQRHVW